MASLFSNAATGVSGSHLSRAREFSESHALARRSHLTWGVQPLILALVTLGTSGCIVPEPPTYDPPSPTAPVLDTFGANPTNLYPTPLPKDRVPGFQFTVPFRSEDSGEEVWAGLYIDWGTDASPLPNNYRRYEPSTYDDDERQIDITIRGTLPSGCHTVSLFVTHMSNTLVDKSGELYLNEDAAKDDLAVATWFFNIDPAATDPTTLSRCPARATVP
jgi:hypothetical protein